MKYNRGFNVFCDLCFSCEVVLCNREIRGKEFDSDQHFLLFS